MEEHRMQQHRGVTLIELIVAVALLAIFAVVAIPSLKSLTQHNRIAAQVNGLVGDLQFARQRAVETVRRVVVCPLDATGTCNLSYWYQGWTVFRNDNPEFPPAFDSQDRIIRVHRLPGGALRLSANQSFFVFRPSGSAEAGTLEICTDDGHYGREIIITPVGRIRLDSSTPTNTISNCGN